MNIVSFSGGKDSSAMLLRLLELGSTVDKIVFADSGYEFPEVYEYLARMEKHIDRKIEFIYSKQSFDHWRKGKITRGKLKGKIRGFPMVVNPCYWSRESKVQPLERALKEADEVYIGIAYDEKHRCSIRDNNLRYPLVEWKWTEQDCVDYLNEKGMLNPIYVNFKRTGCWLCPKQNKGSLYVLWKQYPDLWSRLKELEKENFEDTGRYIFKNQQMSVLEEEFKNGPPKTAFTGYKCSEGCEGVKWAFLDKQKKNE